MKPHHYLLFALLTCCISATAQQAVLTGKITDESNASTPGVTVSVDPAKGWVTSTDSGGVYALSLPAGVYEVTYRYVGKQDQKIKLELAAGDTVIRNIVLSENTRMVDEVVVTGSKYEKKLGEEVVSMNVIKGTLLNDQNMASVDQVMGRIPGVTIADGQVNIRGGAGWSYGAGSRVQVLMDDLPILTSDAADAKWSIVPVENVEQVEVIKGAGSALYGTGALDGIVNVRTAYPTSEPYAKVIVYTGITGPPTRTPGLHWWGSKAPMNGGASFAYRQKFGQHDLVMGGAYNSSDGYLDSSDAHSLRYNIKYRYRFKKVPGLNMGINASIYYSWGKTFFLWKGIDSFGYKPYPNTVSSYNSYRATVDPFVDYTDAKGNHFKFLGRYFNAFNGTNNNQGSVPNRYYTELQYLRRFNFKPFDFNIVGGVVNVFDNVTPPKAATGSLFGKNTSENFSVYAQTDFKFFNRLNVSLGARWEYFNMKHYLPDSNGVQQLAGNQNSLKDLTYPIMRAGVNYQAAQATYIRASFGQGFRFPSIAERYISTTVGPLTIASNPNLQPEKGYNAEIGVKQGFRIGKNWTGYADVAGFLNQYQNMIEFTFGQFGPYASWNDAAQGFGFGFSSQNVGKTRILGTELQLAGQGKIGPVSLYILTGYTFLDPRSLNRDGKLTLRNFQDSVLTNQGTGVLAYNNPDALPYITYAQTTSSSKNILKYTSRHLFKLDVTVLYKGLEWNTNLQFASFQENIDYAFVSPLFTDLLDPTNGTSAFTGLKQYRDEKGSRAIGKGRGDIMWNMYLAYNFKQGVRVAFLTNNLLNWESTPRPAYYDSPRNYTVQLSYTMKGKAK